MKNRLRIIEDRLTGSETRLNEMFRAAFAENEANHLVKKIKKQNRMLAVLIVMITAAAIFSFCSGREEAEFAALDLTRPGAGDLPKMIEADVSAEYGDYETKKRAALRILPREPSEEEANALLLEFERRLPDIILGKNPSLNSITEKLYLPVTDADTGAEISWRSSDPRIISNDGTVNLVGIKKGTAVSLTAYIRLASASDTLHIGVATGQGGQEARLEAALGERLDEAVKEASNTRDGYAVTLPDETPDGVKLKWEPPGDRNGAAVIFICLFVLFFCYTLRYRQASVYIERARSEIERDYPDFVQKLGLLLGAGMVITSAISRIVDDYLATREVYGERRLYEEIAAVQERKSAAGTSLVYEFSELARRSGLRDIMRFSTMLSDNIDKGSKFADKLRIENELLWESRKKRAEKEGRIAETKLIFPMVLQILAVIAITVMPAAFEMGQV